MKTGRAGRARPSGRKQPKPVGAAIEDLARHLGLEKTLEEYEAITSWPDVVGEQIAKVEQAREKDLATRKTALAALIRQWVRHV